METSKIVETTTLFMILVLASFAAAVFCIIPLIGPAGYAFFAGKINYRNHKHSTVNLTGPLITSIFAGSIFFSAVIIWPTSSFDLAWKIAAMNIIVAVPLCWLSYVIDKRIDEKEHREINKQVEATA